MNKASKAFWQLQQELTMLTVEKSEIEIEKDMIKSFTRTHHAIKKELDGFYDKYATKEGITIKQATARLSTKETRMFNSRAKRYLSFMKNHGNNLQDSETRRHAERYSKTAYVARLDELMFNIETKVSELTARVGTEAQQGMKEAFNDGFFKTSFNAAKQFGMKPNFTAPGNKQLLAATQQTWAGRTFSDSLWKNKSALMNTLREVIPDEFVRGMGSDAVALKIQAALGTNLSACKRLARTEMAYTAGQGTKLAYDAAGLDRYEFLATLDNRTSEICQVLDGEVYEVAKIQVGSNYPPMHPNCRSTTIPFYDDDDIAPLVVDRVARNEDGKTIRLGKNVNYGEWINEVGTPAAIAAFAKRKAAFNHLDEDSDEAQAHAARTAQAVEDARLRMQAEAEAERLRIEAELAAQTTALEETPLMDIEDRTEELLHDPTNLRVIGIHSITDPFEEALVDFTAGASGYSELTKALLDNDKAYVKTESKKRQSAAARMIDLIDKAPVNSKPLYRIEEENINRGFKLEAGTEFTMGMRSFTRSSSWMLDVLEGNQDAQFDAPVVFKIKGAKAVNLRPYSAFFAEQEESATAGSFKIVSVVNNKIDGRDVKVVEIKQTSVKPKKVSVPIPVTTTPPVKAKPFSYADYEEIDEDDAIEQMKLFYGGDRIEHHKMPQEYRAYVATGNSFDLNRYLYTGKYDDIKSGKASGDRWANEAIEQIDALKDYINKAPNLHKNVKLVRFVDRDAFEGMLKLAVGDLDEVNSITESVKGAIRGRVDRKEAIKEFTSKAAGIEFEANSFISTSYNVRANVFKGRDYQLEIYAAKGTNALITYNHHESEVVLSTGTKLQFLDLKIKADKAIIIMRAYPNETE